MGNSMETPKMFFAYEHSSGKRLLASIQTNERDVTQAAIDFARKEFTKPISIITANSSDYDDMSSRMEKYLTKPYDVGDGIIFRKTPLEYCQSIGSLESAAVINENLQKLSSVYRAVKKTKDGKEIESTTPPGGIESLTVGTVTHDRAALAKSRLQAFHASKRQSS